MAQICTKSFVGWGFASDPTGELTALPRPIACLGVELPRKGKEGGEGGKEGREGFPECPNPELASISCEFRVATLLMCYVSAYGLQLVTRIVAIRSNQSINLYSLVNSRYKKTYEL